MFGFELFRRRHKSNSVSSGPKPNADSVQGQAAAAPVVVYGYIYSAVCRNNNKGYVGQTTQEPKQRWQQHKQDATAKKQTNGLTKRFHFALHEHGANTFDFKVIDTASSHEDLNEKERYWVAHYKYADPAFGYNSTSGGGSQKEHTQSANEADRQASLEVGSKRPFDWTGKATDPQKRLLRKLYSGKTPPYCICDNSKGSGELCANCGRRTGLSIRLAGNLISNFLVGQMNVTEMNVGPTTSVRPLEDLATKSRTQLEAQLSEDWKASGIANEIEPPVPTIIKDVGNMLVQQLPPEDYESSELRWSKTCRGNYNLSLYVFRSDGSFITNNGLVSIFGCGRVNGNPGYAEKYQLRATIHDQTFESFYPTFALAIAAADKLVEIKAPDDYKRLRRDYKPPADERQRGYLKTLYGSREFPADLTYKDALRLIKEHRWVNPSTDTEKQKGEDDKVVANILGHT
jgi:group I intron endonuclease